jgi:hypothetical protein
MSLYIYCNCFTKYWPDSGPLGSKHGAVKITKNKSVLTVCIYRHQVHCPETEFRKMRAAAALSPTGLRHSTALEPPNV